MRIADQTGAAPAAIAAAFAAVRNSYDMIALNSEIDALDNKMSGQGAARRSTPPCRTCCSTGWSGSCAMSISRRGSTTIVAHYREGIAQVAAALDDRAVEAGRRRRATRARPSSSRAGVPEALARRIANLPCSRPRPTSCWSPTAPSKPVAEVTATYFAAEAFFQLDRVAGAVPDIVVSDYFDRLALDRALDSIGDAERRLDRRDGRQRRAPAPARWRHGSSRAQAEVERIRAAIHEIAGSGLTLSKLSVAASLLGDLVQE